VFNIVIILFVVISILLIYSLLMITTETKTFDVGVMRLTGLSSCGFISMILTQGVMFVLPSILSAYICAYPILFFIFKKLFGNS
jgi:ABC-type antimicrobial peptide transport system permease subunit